VLKLYINLGSVLQSFGAATGTSLTSQITGAIDWRREGIRYRKNEVNIDVFENISLTTSATGQLLHSEVQGRVMMKTQLTGMPECKFGLNDKLIMEKEGGGAGGKPSGVEIDDCTFHRYLTEHGLMCDLHLHKILFSIADVFALENSILRERLRSFLLMESLN
jgi:AP-2 complex subunit mu-1